MDFLGAKFQNSCDRGRKVIPAFKWSVQILGNILYARASVRPGSCVPVMVSRFFVEKSGRNKDTIWGHLGTKCLKSEISSRNSWHKIKNDKTWQNSCQNKIAMALSQRLLPLRNIYVCKLQNAEIFDCLMSLTFNSTKRFSDLCPLILHNHKIALVCYGPIWIPLFCLHLTTLAKREPFVLAHSKCAKPNGG